MKYLLEIHHGIGDIVQYTGLIKSVRNYDKDAYIGVVLNKESYKALLTNDKDIDEIFIIDFSGSKTELLKGIHKIRRQHFDYMVCSIHSKQKSMEFMAVTFGSKLVVGSKLAHLNRISKRFINVQVNSNEHVVKQNNDVLLGLNLNFQLFEPYLVCKEPPYELKKHTVGLCIGTSIPQKTWPIERYIAVGEFLENKGYAIVLLGGKKEAEQFETCGYKNEKWTNLLGKMDLIGSASECSQCELIIGGDTGLMHMAAAVGTKTLTLFSCSEPTTHVPFSKDSYFYFSPTKCQYCFGTNRLLECSEYKCLTSIDTNIVCEIVEGILESSEKVEKYKFRI